MPPLPARRRAGRLLTAVAGLAAAVSLGLPALPAAASSPPPGIGVGVTTWGTPPPAGTPGTPGAPTPVSYPTPAAPPPPTQTFTYYNVAWFPPASLPVPAGVGSFTGCGPDGYGAAAEGANYWYKIYYQSLPNGAGSNIIPVPGSLGWTCLYPPHSHVVSAQCVLTTGPATITGPADNPVVPSTTLKYIPAQPTAFAAGGEQNAALCPQSYRLAASTTVKHWGRYTGVARATAATCAWRVYDTVDPKTGTIPGTVRLGCSFPYTITDTAQIYVWCGGWGPGYGNAALTFTAADCSNTAFGHPTWGCRIGAPTIDGHLFPATGWDVMDDATGHTLRWGSVAFTGAVRNPRNLYSRLYVDPVISTPWRGSRLNTEAASSDQPFLTVPTIDQWTPGWVSTWTAKWSQAGYSHRPWTAFPQYEATAQFATVVVTITGWDLATGTMTSTTSTGWVTAQGSCNGAPAWVNVFRVRNAN